MQQTQSQSRNSTYEHELASDGRIPIVPWNLATLPHFIPWMPAIRYGLKSWRSEKGVTLQPPFSCQTPSPPTSVIPFGGLLNETSEKKAAHALDGTLVCLPPTLSFTPLTTRRTALLPLPPKALQNAPTPKRPSTTPSTSRRSSD